MRAPEQRLVEHRVDALRRRSPVELGEQLQVRSTRQVGVEGRILDEPGNVVDIMEALKRSLQAGADRRPRAPSKKPAEVAEPERKTTARKTAARKAAR